MVSNYVRGRSREYRVKKKMIQSGAVYVYRSWGSHGPFDLIVIFPDRVELIQVKKNRISDSEVKRLKEIRSKINADNIIIKIVFLDRKYHEEVL